LLEVAGGTKERNEITNDSTAIGCKRERCIHVESEREREIERERRERERN